MGLFDRILGKGPAPRGAAAPPSRPSEGGGKAADSDDWYVPQDGNSARFVPRAGNATPLRLVESRGQLRLVEDETGLLVSPTDRRLSKLGLFVASARGTAHYASKKADLRPGTSLRLVREPTNPHDEFAVAIHAQGTGRVGYFNKQKARAVAAALDAGEPLEALSIRGEGPGSEEHNFSLLAASPALLAALRTPRAAGRPPVRGD